MTPHRPRPVPVPPAPGRARPSGPAAAGGRPPAQTRGLALIDSLIAVTLLCLGLLGLAGVQMRMLSELRSSTSRAQAIQLIEDMAHRLAVNREAVTTNLQSGASTSATAFPYALAWGSTLTFTATSCASATCTSTQLAQRDVAEWAARVRATLPGGNATVFQSSTDPRQVGIAVGWLSFEGKAADTGGITQYLAPLTLTAASHGVNCPANLICHVVYVQP